MERDLVISKNNIVDMRDILSEVTKYAITRILEFRLLDGNDSRESTLCNYL